ncbi:MAG: prolipoprotein diacylglyceryl transferase [Bacteroidetes bacterium CG2_30_32_10]|nr:MAG: prolipoprotein diacylglyceryl transferase [Bacteroidetes bacterium CG2_30_32_10]
MLTYITWNVNPEIFNILGFPLRWYGLLFASAFIFAYLILANLFKKEKIPIELLDKLTLYVGLGTIIGARLGHCLLYEPAFFLTHPLQILKIWEGGLASHGAAIGILFSIYLFCKKTGKKYLWVLDKLVIVIASAGFFIRMGNLMNSEIYGYPTNLPWAFIFVRENSLPSHPTQIYEGLSYLLLFFFLYKLYQKTKDKYESGFVFGAFLVLLFTIRFLLEFLKEPQVDSEKSMLLNLGQLYSIPFILVGIYFMVLRKKKQVV